MEGLRSSADMSSSFGYVSWEEVNLSGERGRREVHYFLKRFDGASDLAVIGREKSLRHISYHYAIRNRSVLLSLGPLSKLKSRREVVDWLSSVVSGSLAHLSSPVSGSLDNSDTSELDIEAFKDIQSRHVGNYTKEFSWLGSPWTCRKRRKHYQSFSRNSVKISVHDFVYVLAEEGKRLVAYLEDMYEESKGSRMVVVRWFHKIDEVGFVLPHNYNDREIFFSLCLQDLNVECIDGLATVLSPQHFTKFLKRAVHTKFDPFVCYKQFENDDAKPFDITQVKGYWKQEIFRYIDTVSNSKSQSFSQRADNGLLMAANATDAIGIRPWKRLRRLKDDVLVGSKELVQEVGLDTTTSSDKLRGGVEPTASLAVDEVKHNPVHFLKVGSDVEVLSQDSGIRGCWFRALIIKKHKNKVKVRYQDVKDADDESKSLEEWILASRVAGGDKHGIRVSGRNIVRPIHPHDKGKVAGLIDVGTAVDTWWHDAWWEGIVVKKESEDRIHVYFPEEKQESVFCATDVRLSHEWLANEWTPVEKRPDIAQLSCLEQERAEVGCDANKLASIRDDTQSEKTISGRQDSSSDLGSDKRKYLALFGDLAKDDLLAQLRWKSSRKRKRISASSGHKMNKIKVGVRRSTDIIGSRTQERFLVPMNLKVDHDNCKYMGDSLFNSTVVPPLTNLVMSR
ncbi:hypothetical protein K2173_017132 [Erythroxylum novogranatense]|uniref:BAH domain-containing protein n=1 Tax=Erythroxylum novogranatense TaxID=1862640 RepID=A0AAV8U5T4_9ROSI|nr:hypothetical protein K2173_017132 [Erythroxylum novogranatense]